MAASPDGSIGELEADHSSKDRGGLPTGQWGVLFAVVAALGVLGGLVLRFNPPSPLWLDEALSVNIANLALGDQPDALRHDGHPILYYYVLHFWMEVFGSADGAVRALSGVAGIAAVFGVTVSGQRVGGRRVGVIAGLLLLASPFAIRYSTEARMYAIVSLVVVLGQMLIRSNLLRPTLPRMVAIATCSALLIHLHYWSGFLLGSVVVVLAWGMIRGGVEHRAGGGTLVSILIGVSTFGVWLPVFLEQAAHTGTPWAPALRPTQAVAATLVDLGLGRGTTEGALVSALMAIALFLGAFGWSRLASSGNSVVEIRASVEHSLAPEVGIIILTLVGGSAASFVVGATFAPRYAAVVLPLLILVAARGISLLDDGLMVATMGALVGLGLLVAVDDYRTDRSQAGEIASALLTSPHATGGGLVVYCPDQLGPSVSRSLPQGVFDEVIFPELESPEVDSPSRVDWFDYEDRHRDVSVEGFVDLVEQRADADPIWIVSSPGYRIPGGTCDEVVAEMAGRRIEHSLVREAGDDYHEPASLREYVVQ